MEDYLGQLNDQQRQAVVYLDTPQLVIAGAGSGKTRVLTYKIIHLLAKGYNPARILALTFTNKAANEMKERITSLMGEGLTRRLWMGTFHSMFLRILRLHYDKIGYRTGFTIYDAADSKNLVKSIIKDMDLDDKVYKPSVIHNAISMAKNALISPSAYAMDKDLMEIDKRSKKPLIHAIYRTYQQRCQVANVMDFDDILYYTNLLLSENQDIAHHYREFFQYVMVDEYQDTNFAQHRIVRILTEGQNNLSVVGDDAQSIYSFRGANIANILRLKEFYPNLATFKLERNYRSTQNIIEAANSLIEKNTRQIRKQIFSENEKGKRIEVIKSYSDFEEGYLVANKISTIQLANHDSFSDFAILYRTNAQSRILEESLRKRNIPYKIYGALSFYQRKEIKDAIAYFRLAVNPNDDEALRRIINFPARGIGDTTLNKVAKAALERNLSLWDILQPENISCLSINSGTKKKLESFRELIKDFVDRNIEGNDAFTLAEHIIRRTTLLSSLLTDRTPESISKQENLNELLNGVKNFVDNRLEEGDAEHQGMTDFLNEVSLASDIDSEEGESTESVTMMTVHAAKGLEFKNVIIVGVEEDLFPAALSTSSVDGIEEERRLLYVAITRAKKQCVITYAGTRYRNGQTVICRSSRFIDDIGAQFLSFAGDIASSRSEKFIDPVSKYKDDFGRNSASASLLYNRFAKAGATDSMPRTTVADSKNGVLGSVNSSDDFRLHSLKELNVGMLIDHSRFGKGRISNTEIVENNERIVVEFYNEGKKTLLLKFARFKVLPS